MEQRIFWTRIRNEVSVLKYGDAWNMLKELREIQRDNMSSDAIFVIFRHEPNGDYLLRAVGDYAKYQNFKQVVEQKYPDLCEFNVEVDG